LRRQLFTPATPKPLNFSRHLTINLQTRVNETAMNSHKTEPRLTSLVLGPRTERRRAITLVLWGGLLYFFNTLLCWWSIGQGFVDPVVGRLLMVLMPAGPITFYLLLRTGWSSRLKDPSMVLAQATYFIVVTAIGYVGVRFELRGGVLTIVPLVLMFGQFSLKPSELRQLGRMAMVCLALALAMWTTFHQGSVQLAMDIVQLTYISGVVLLTSRIAQAVAKWRIELEASRRELKNALAHVNRLATQDALTDLPNRRHMMEMLQQAHHRQQVTDQPFSLGIIDLDHFKQLNDAHGHQTGDQALQHFATMARRVLRDSDAIARWGGEEFLVLSLGANLDQIVSAIERLRTALQDHPLESTEGRIELRFSAGVACQRIAEAVEETISRADKALYDAKHAGRNQTSCAA